MKRTITVIGAVLLLLAPAGTALARGGGWQPVPANPYDWSCGPTTVHISFPENKEYFRELPQPDGSIIEQVTGFLSVNFATDAGGSVTKDISGPGKDVIYPNGDFEFNSTGQNGLTLTEEQASSIGMPQIFVSSGPIDVIFHADGSVTAIRLPKVFTDICAELT